MFSEPIVDSIERLAILIKNSQNTYAITGAGISTAAGIPDLKHISESKISLFSEGALKDDPEIFYDNFHKLVLDPIFKKGPTTSHKVLAQLENDGLLNGIVTNNVDYLHEIAGNKNVADIWSNLNINHCAKCGRVFPIDFLRARVPACPVCGGLLIPDPISRDKRIDESQYGLANQWMREADLVIVIGANDYYDNIPKNATVVNINPHKNYFDKRAQLVIRSKADHVFRNLDEFM